VKTRNSKQVIVGEENNKVHVVGRDRTILHMCLVEKRTILNIWLVEENINEHVTSGEEKNNEHVLVKKRDENNASLLPVEIRIIPHK
jgi:hypothetical protein